MKKPGLCLLGAVLLCGALPAAAQTASNSTPAVPATLTVPAGFGISVYASGLAGARLMAVSPEGILVVAQRANVVALPDANGDGQAEPKVLLTDLTYAHSVAFANGYLYIATTPAILRVRWANGSTVGTPEPIAELPSSKPSLHSSRTIRVGPDGRLYVTIGSSCNFCIEPDPRRTTMQVFNADGSNGHAFATGLRNAVGFDWDPQTRRLWAGDNGIDKSGDETPTDEINLVEEGKNYGHPFVIGRGLPSPLTDDRSAADRARARTMDPAFDLPPHMAPMGIAFYTGSRFPAAYRTSLYVALHGSTDRTTKVGYKVVRVIMDNGRPVGSEDFITGWLTGETVTGRPAGIVTGADGALYVSDDNKGFIYRVVAQRGAAPTPADATARIVASANALLATLDDAGRSKVQFPFDGPKRTNWSNLPSPMYQRQGLRLGDLTAVQRDAAMKVVAAALSGPGYKKVTEIMHGDELLKQPGGGRGPTFGEAEYYVAFVGKPSTTDPWILQFGGHHLAINLTMGGSQATMAPSHTAAQPASYTVEGRTVRPLGAENDKAFALINSLDGSQRSKAVLNYKVADLVLGPGQDGKTIQPEGIIASALNAPQQAMLLEIVREWAGIMNDAYSAPRMADIKAALPQTYFAWSGPTILGSQAYFRIQGPALVIEYAPQNSLDHIHTIYRDPTNDYGAKFTRK